VSFVLAVLVVLRVLYRPNTFLNNAIWPLW